MNPEIAAKITHKEYLLLDETISVLTGAQSQLDLVDHFDAASERGQGHWSFEGEQAETLNDLNLYQTKGKLQKLFYELYSAPSRRSVFPGQSPVMFPKIRPMALTYIDHLLTKTFLLGRQESNSNSNQQPSSTDQRSVHLLNDSLALINLIGKSYFPEDQTSSLISESQLRELKSNFDPFSMWMAKASNFLLQEGSLWYQLKPLPEAEESSVDKIFWVKGADGRIQKMQEVLELKGVPKHSFQKVQLKVEGSAVPIDLTYDIHSLLVWMKNNVDRFTHPSPLCQQFKSSNAAGEFGSYIGSRISIHASRSKEKTENLDLASNPTNQGTQTGGAGVKPDSGIQPGGAGVKPNKPGIRAAESNLKPSLPMNSQSFLHPNIRVPDL